MQPTVDTCAPVSQKYTRTSSNYRACKPQPSSNCPLKPSTKQAPARTSKQAEIRGVHTGDSEPNLRANRRNRSGSEVPDSTVIRIPRFTSGGETELNQDRIRSPIILCSPRKICTDRNLPHLVAQFCFHSRPLERSRGFGLFRLVSACSDSAVIRRCERPYSLSSTSISIRVPPRHPHTIASVKLRTSPVIRASPYVFLSRHWGMGTQLSNHHPDSIRCFRTVPSVAQCRVMSNEEGSGVNFPSNFTLRRSAQ
jgi:hypothetical protein